jgi:hypothetical protein
MSRTRIHPAIARPCPVCGVEPGQACIDEETGKRWAKNTVHWFRVGIPLDVFLKELPW